MKAWHLIFLFLLFNLSIENAQSLYEVNIHKTQKNIDDRRLSKNSQNDLKSNTNSVSLTNIIKQPQVEDGKMFYWGIYLGILIILFIYNLFLYFSVNESTLLYYSILILVYSQYEFSRNAEFANYSHNIFVWNNYSHLFKHLDDFLVCIGMIFQILFTLNFLNLKQLAPRINKIALALIIYFSILCLVVIFNYNSLSKSIIEISALMGLLFSVLSGGYLWIRRNKLARFFLLANIIYFIGIIIVVLQSRHLISTNFGLTVYKTDNLGQISFFCILAFAIGDKINIAKTEIIEAQEKALNFLEKKVQERTIEVVNQKEVIEEKNRNIIDSINYAKRIQQAKLPKKEEIYSILTNCFVLFKPKDIVSGDFYFFARKEESIFIAAADCTGHGIPGAFMSMIGSERLEEAISHSEDPSEILRLLNVGMKTALNQSDNIESTRDGMDIALCTVNATTRVVKYAGANRPLWIIRKGQAVIEEIKATKNAIGGLTGSEQFFTSHELNLSSGDTLYISTDGYADTFNGRTNKKITTKKFKEIICAIQGITMHDQEKYLDDYVENWKFEAEQTDDILVIGIRL